MSDMEQNFEPTTIISPGNYPTPKEGHIGYVKFENPYEYIGETKPRFFDVDEHGFEVVG